MKKKRSIKKLLFGLLAVLCAWFMLHTAVISIDGLNDTVSTTDAAVVLGNKIEADGTPSKRLQSRLDKAVELYTKHYFEYIIVSGGTGKEGFNEAAVMKSYLLSKGVPEMQVLVDQNGVDTYATAHNTKNIMDMMGFDSVTIITQFFHITRTTLAFEKVGIATVCAAHSDYFELRDIYSLIREFFAYYKYVLVDR